MKNNFSNFHFNFKLNHGVIYTWMCRTSGDGELESEYQGRQADTSFLQETGGKNKVQRWSRIDHLPTLHKSAGCTMVSDSSPLLFLFVRNGKNLIIQNKLV